MKVPDGIAHFLEHKLFEKEDGDVFQLFGQQGASANAFTSFTKTSYLFSTTDQVEKNLTTLIDFCTSTLLYRRNCKQGERNHWSGNPNV